MSRGSRVATSGNILTSMRDNYAQHGVDDYYRKVGATYRNPHYPGVRQCLFSWFTNWWQREHLSLDTDGPVIFDMACGSGEVTVALQEWWIRGLTIPSTTIPSSSGSLPLPRRFAPPPVLSDFGPDTPVPKIIATDPYTAEAFRGRVSLPCAALSFQDVASGLLPPSSFRLPLRGKDSEVSSQDPPGSELDMVDDPIETIEMTVCSFALHLIETPSELFALLWELSTKCRWLVILAPHKKPEIKDGWGWAKWDVNNWSECRMSDNHGEYLFDRVHCRVYRSLNLPQL
ncbi:hypothetical protein BV25DRAFT_1992014 [Artomyces pyxidatus]|uniref:Uncharacterized protein n=1 Tax=Artomyces pyxidatus TaxID=48021 RepID=A0ACB8T0P9_9AGAM|nr:hypothetical protein BV25DRAFT_1992014 [Artomyces pyxidatus]